MSEPIYIAKREADQNTPAFQQAVARAKAEDLNLIHVTPEMTLIPQNKRGDHAAYREASKCAKVLGVEVTWADPDGDANQDPTHFDADHVVVDGTMWLNAGQVDPRTYRRLTEKARSEHLELKPLRSWNDAPEGVIDALRAHAA